MKDVLTTLDFGECSDLKACSVSDFFGNRWIRRDVQVDLQGDSALAHNFCCVACCCHGNHNLPHTLDLQRHSKCRKRLTYNTCENMLMLMARSFLSQYPMATLISVLQHAGWVLNVPACRGRQMLVPDDIKANTLR